MHFGWGCMERVCLIVDLDQEGLSESWQEALAGHDVHFEVKYASLDEALVLIANASILMLVIFCKDEAHLNQVTKLLELYQDKIGPLAHFQAMVCTSPSPQYLTQVYEYGLEQFFSEENWAAELAAKAREIDAILNDPESSEARIIKLSASIAKGDQGGIAEAEAGLGDAHEYDYLAAFSKASALQAIGKFDEAAEAFKHSGQMNKKFRSADSRLGENLMVLGRVDEAVAVFEKLERTNKNSAERKAMLASAYMEKGDFEKAKEMLALAKECNPDHPKIREARAQMLLATGKAAEAFKMMNELEEVGPFLAAKLNEMGIKLSQAGKGASSLALYKKAHRVVRKELRYKVSLNAALACYRLKDFKMALKYLARCEKEYGRSLEKVEKIRNACKQAIAKSSKSVKEAS